jgi:hypothetical protein
MDDHSSPPCVQSQFSHNSKERAAALTFSRAEAAKASAHSLSTILVLIVSIFSFLSSAGSLLSKQSLTFFGRGCCGLSYLQSRSRTRSMDTVTVTAKSFFTTVTVSRVSSFFKEILEDKQYREHECDFQKKSMRKSRADKLMSMIHSQRHLLQIPSNAKSAAVDCCNCYAPHILHQ